MTAAAATATKSATTAAAAGTLASFTDRKGAALQLPAVQGFNRLLGILAAAHLDERKTTRTTGIAIKHQLDLDRLVSFRRE